MALSLAINATTTQKALTQTIEAIFGVQAGNTILNSLSDAADATSLTAVANSLIDFVDASTKTTPETFAAVVVANLGITEVSGLSADEVSVAEEFVVGLLNTAGTANWGSALLGLASDFSAFTGDAVYGAAATAFNSSVIASLDYSLDPANTDIRDSGDGGVVNVFNLTTGQDNLIGTADSDSFIAHIFNNSNTAQSGDIINGGSGNDSLEIDVGDSQSFAIALETESVENFSVRVQDASNGDDTDNNLLQGVHIDAERMEGVTRFEDNNSRGDLLIEDVRIQRVEAYGDNSNEITKDITIAMVSTDPGNVDYGVYFDQHSLVKQGDQTSNAITLTVGNQVEVDDFDAAKPLEDIPYTNVAFNVQLAGAATASSVTLTLDLVDVETYDQMFTQLQLAFNAEQAINPLLADVTLTRSIGTDTFFSKDGILRVADEYLLEISSGQITPADIGWFASGGLPSNNAFSATVEVGDVTVSSNLITSTIILDDVGRGSQGGTLVVGGLSIGDTSDSKGVEQFDITVERNSELREIQSTNNTLEEVYIVNGTTKGDLVVAGSTYFGGSAALSNSDLPGSDADFRGFTDVRIVDASAMEGKVTIDAILTDAIVAKYAPEFNLQDTDANPAADNLDFIYTLGTNDDRLTLEIDEANLEAAGTTTREDFNLNVSGGAGNDSITTRIGTGKGTDTSNWYINSKINANLTVNGDAGDDTITTTGAGDFNINAGSGNDTVYTNNDGNTGAVDAVNEQQTLTFSAASQLVPDGDGFITVHGVAVQITDGNTALQVAQAIDAALSGHADFSGAGGSVVFDVNAVAADTTVNVVFTFDNAATAVFPADKPAIVVVENISTEATMTVASGAAGTDAVTGTAEVTNITFNANNEAIGNTIIFNGTTITLADTDASGVVEQDEVAEQFAAATFANYTVTDFDNSSGVVQLTATATGADQNALTATIAAADIAAGDFTGTATVPATVNFAAVGGSDVGAGADGTGDTAVAAAGQDILTFTAADETGTFTIYVDADGDATTGTDPVSGATDGRELAVTVNLLETDSAISVATKAAAALDAALGADWTIAAVGDGTVTVDTSAALGAVVDMTARDGAVIAATTIAETTKGQDPTTGTAAKWVVNSVNTAVADLQSNQPVANGILYKSTLTVTYSDAFFAASGVTNDAAVAFDNGFESTVVIPTTDFLGGQLEVNQAIKAAINEDAVLSKFLVANDGPANTLVITSLVDGKVVAADLAIDISAPAVGSLTAVELSGLNAAYKSLIDDSSAATLTEAGALAVIATQISAIDAGGAYTTTKLGTNAVGTEIAGNNSTSVSDNLVDLGSGNDVAVLGTDDTSNDTLIFSGTFGDDTIFNFEDTITSSLDLLDFTAYLGNQISLTGSSISAITTATTGTAGSVSAGSDLVQNEVHIVTGFVETATDTFDSMTGADVLAAINSVDAYANLGNAVDTNGTIANLFGNVQNNVLLIENSLNDGEYKVFSLTATNDASTAFTSVTLVGSVDFGDSITATDAIFV